MKVALKIICNLIPWFDRRGNQDPEGERGRELQAHEVREPGLRWTLLTPRAIHFSTLGVDDKDDEDKNWVLWLPEAQR